METTTAPIISLRGITKHFGGVYAIRDVDLNIAPNIFIGREILRRGVGRGFKILNYGRMFEETRKVMERLNVKIPDLKKKVFCLSGGQRQSVAISKAIYFNARLIIMDEPSASLGVEQTEKVYCLIRELKKNNIAVILISHNINEVFGLADRSCV